MTGEQPPTVSLILTALNEAESIADLLSSIEHQTVLPAEVIVVDGGSQDGTPDILEEWKRRLPLSVISSPGASISKGRNLAIENATGEIIAVTDAGVELDNSWLEHLLATLTQQAVQVDVASGLFEPDGRGTFEDALAASTLPDACEIDPDVFLPSSRSVAFRRSWFDAGVRYPEWLDYCEDLIFDLRLKRAGARFMVQPLAIVRFRPRHDVRSFWRQYYLYARGDGKAGLFWKRHLIRYLTYLVLLPSLVLVRRRGWRVLVLLGAAAYMKQPVERLWRRTGGDLRAMLLLMPLAAALRGIGDLAKMVGYPAGLVWRRRKYGLRRDWRSIPERREGA